MDQRIRIIFFKELTEVLRDRRTLVATFLLPIMVYPLMLLVVGGLLSFQAKRISRESHLVGVYPADALGDLNMWRNELKAENADAKNPDLASTPASTALGAPGNIGLPRFIALKDNLLDGIDDPLKKGLNQTRDRIRKALKQYDNLQAAVVFDNNYIQFIRKKKPVPVVVFSDSTDIRSTMVAGKAGDILNYGQRKLAAERIRKMKRVLRHVDTDDAKTQKELAWIRSTLSDKDDTIDYLQPVTVSSCDIADEDTRKGYLLGALLPMMVVLLTVVSCVHPAIDMVAGERERGTLETLLICPVPASHLVTGKFLAVVTLSLISAFLNVASMGLSLSMFPLPELVTGQTPWLQLAGVLVLMIPLSFLFSAMWMAIASVAADYREAQAYISPGMLLCILPTQIALIPGINLSGGWMYLPIGNMVLLGRELIMHSATLSQVLFVFISTTIYAVVAILVAMQLFGREEVLFATKGTRVLLNRKRIRPRAMPSPGEAMVVLIVAFLLFLYLPIWALRLITGPASADHASESAVIGFWILPFIQSIAFLAWPFFMTWYAKLDFKQTFSLKKPAKRRHWIGIVPMGLGTLMLVMTLSTIMISVFGGVDAQTGFLDEQFKNAFHMIPLPALVFIIAVTPAVCEELLFRGYLTSGLKDKLPEWKTILIVGALFGLYHVQPFRIVTAAVTGSVLTFICLRTGSIYPGMLMHFLNNGLVVLLSTQAVSTRMPDWLIRILDPNAVGERSIGGIMAFFYVGLILFGIGLWFYRKLPETGSDSGMDMGVSSLDSPIESVGSASENGLEM